MLEEGSLTAHMTIVARAMGVPVVGRIADIRHVASEGDLILVDGDSGTVVVRPTAPLAQAFEQRMAMSQKRRAEYAALRDLPAETNDGVNGLADGQCRAGRRCGDARRDPAPTASACSAPNSSSSSRPPCRAARASSGSTRSVLDAAGDKPVMFRTVDIGGDKALPYLNDVKDEAENPAMGWRALRLASNARRLMKAQARALIEAAAGRDPARDVPDGVRAVGI